MSLPPNGWRHAADTAHPPAPPMIFADDSLGNPQELLVGIALDEGQWEDHTCTS